MLLQLTYPLFISCKGKGNEEENVGGKCVNILIDDHVFLYESNLHHLLQKYVP